jgi:shikimate kinase/3-dehydroquinate synthase
MIMNSNTAPRVAASPTGAAPHVLAALGGRSLVLVGLMGAGKTSIGRRLAARLGLPFKDADAEIEQAAGCSVQEIFARYGEMAFRDGERRVIRRLMSGPPTVIATGGGAWMDPQTREAVAEAGISVWLRCPIPVLVRRVRGRDHRPLLRDGDPAEILNRLAAARHPFYAMAEITVDCTDERPDVTTARVMDAIGEWGAGSGGPRFVPVRLATHHYTVTIGDELLAQAGALLAPVLPSRRAVVITDDIVAPLHLPALREGLTAAEFRVHPIIAPAGESSKSLQCYSQLMLDVLALGIDRGTSIIALGGGVVGDLAGFVAATALRGLAFVQVPTTLLSQVDSSVGGKTGINTPQGKNLVGAFHQPRAVLADAGTLRTLPSRELRAGYAEIVKAGLIGDLSFYEWCEAHGLAVVSGDAVAQAEAVARACAFKAAVVGDDEREEKLNDGRALLNLGHTFAHALEAERHFDGTLLHGEAVAIGLGLAFRLSARLGLVSAETAERVVSHIGAVGLVPDLRRFNHRFSAEALMGHMRKDKKNRDGELRFVLARGIGRAFTASDVPPETVMALLRDEGCEA